MYTRLLAPDLTSPPPPFSSYVHACGDCLNTPLSFSEFTALALALGNTPAGMCCGLSEHIHVHPHVLYTCGMLCTLVLSATFCGFNLPLVQFSGSLVLYFAIFCSVFPPSPLTSLYRFSFSLSLSLSLSNEIHLGQPYNHGYFTWYFT